MGIAERFKNKLNKRNIFENNYISTPLETKTIKPIKNLLKAEKTTQISEPEDLLSSNSDLKEQIMKKIRQTPYWSEFSVKQKSKMIGSYFDKKCENISNVNKENFVQNIINLSDSEL